jgi:hypothetical protein
MRASKRHVPSPALVVACLALAIALSGAGYAAVKLPRNSVGTAQLKKNAVVSSKVKNGSLKAADFAPGQLQAAGPAGGDLAGAYPNPTIANGAVTQAKLAPPAGFVSAGLGDVGGGCLSTVGWFDLSPNVNNSASYYRDPYGTVHLRGVAIKCGATSDTVFTLPVGLRPGSQEVQVVQYSTGPGRIDVNPTGTVVAAIAPAAGTWMSLDGITFRCAPSGSNGCP